METGKTRDKPTSILEENKFTSLPKHVVDLMFGTKGLRKTKTGDDFHPTGLLGVGDLHDILAIPPRNEPWVTDSERKFPEISTRRRTKTNAVKRIKTKAELSVKPVADKYLKYNKMINENPYHKIAFKNTDNIRDALPSWCQHRLRTACRSARFELPSDKHILERLSPLQFLAKYTRLYSEQRRRYSLIFNKNKTKEQNHIVYHSLYPALNNMLGMCLSEKNFHTLCTALFIDKNSLMDETTFIGVCTFADRLFWTSYLDYLDMNTFIFLGPNRSVLEYVDFENLKRKIDGLNLSKEMYHLLYSLA